MSDIQQQVLHLLSENPEGLRVCDFTGAYNKYYHCNMVLAQHGFKKLTTLFEHMKEHVEIVDLQGVKVVKAKADPSQDLEDPDHQNDPESQSYLEDSSAAIPPPVTPSPKDPPLIQLKNSLKVLWKENPKGVSLAQVRKSCYFLLKHPDLLRDYPSMKHLLNSMTDVVQLQGIGVQTYVCPAPPHRAKTSSAPTQPAISMTASTARPPSWPSTPPPSFPPANTESNKTIVEGIDKPGGVHWQPVPLLPLPPPPLPDQSAASLDPTEKLLPRKKRGRRRRNRKSQTPQGAEPADPIISFGIDWAKLLRPPAGNPIVPVLFQDGTEGTKVVLEKQMSEPHSGEPQGGSSWRCRAAGPQASDVRLPKKPHQEPNPCPPLVHPPPLTQLSHHYVEDTAMYLPHELLWPSQMYPATTDTQSQLDELDDFQLDPPLPPHPARFRPQPPGRYQPQ
ncbi:uncharacterized protein LOC136768782 [Amia ocellicauda]|uniref:uncharacterized protein LOC136768782 n=1 Tax=Amia ocellicauda TaxID=2972642 RepID=UPI0034646815